MSSFCRADKYRDATKAALRATYIQTGWKKNVDKYADRMKVKYAPEFLINNGGALLFIADSFIKQKVEVKLQWRFP